MSSPLLGEFLRSRGVTRRDFLQFCTTTTALMGLSSTMVPRVAAALEQARRPSVIWLPFQECTGCTESITRAHGSTLESLIFQGISLDYQHTLQAAAGDAAERARETAMKENWGRYLLIVDGSIPTGNKGFSTVAGRDNLSLLQEVARGAAAIVALGSCAAFGGIPGADPNPTGAVAVSAVVKDKPIINVSGCPPIPVVITGVLTQYLTFGKLPELDALGRPRSFYGQTIHDRCYRRPFYERGQFADSFDDEGARQGWCLYKLGCKGPTTHNACATVKWNDGTSFPIEAGHGCIGCSEPGFWDKGGFYQPLSTGQWGSARTVGTAVGVGAALGLASAALARKRQKDAEGA
ncbi:MAG: hydrogenase small subunit [Gammaproteobacteria bacterium]|nr:hydrogenase small subunit [Gammaproteobacteria bacterium]MDH4310796.1 hydrogenase small subunit [Gammaproteobacteria bacterium]MDH5271793.1 hydrogenase small subunit [Gammaproteobacteria bacterium]